MTVWEAPRIGKALDIAAACCHSLPSSRNSLWVPTIRRVTSRDSGSQISAAQYDAMAADYTASNAKHAYNAYVAGQLIDKYRPGVLVLNAGATPLPRPVQHHTWQTFSRNWDTDVQHVFHWVREALLAPLEPGSTVVTLSSGAALRGSPLSGGYAGAKAAIRWLTAYAADESGRDKLGIRFVSVLPQLTPATALGAVFTAAYAARQGADAAAPADPRDPVLTPDQVGQAITGLVAGPGPDQDAYLLTAAGLRPLP
jgi:NADP-dependent 3-hydroxy acid dehydrogenase YdfG